MDAAVRDMLGMMAGRRSGDAATKARDDETATASALAARGTLNSGYGQLAIFKKAVTAHEDAARGTLADFLSVAEDVHADDRLFDEIEAMYVQRLEDLGRGLRTHLTHGNRMMGVAAPSANESINQALARLKQEAKIAFGRERLRRRTAAAAASTHPARQMQPTVDVAARRRDFFLSHAGEDRADFVGPLAEEIVRRGHTLWFSEYEITLGDSLRAKIDRGLADSRFGVVVLSPAFFEKPWTQAELDALASRAAQEGRKVILPIRHRLTFEDLRIRSPLLAGVVSVDSSAGTPAVVDAILKAYAAESRSD